MRIRLVGKLAPHNYNINTELGASHLCQRVHIEGCNKMKNASFTPLFTLLCCMHGYSDKLMQV